VSASSQAPVAPLTVRAVEACVACGGRVLRPLAMRYEWRGSFPLVECDACALRFLAVQPDAAGLRAMYSAEYFESDFRCGRSAVAYADESAFRAENAGLLAAFARVVSRPGRLLEVGCAGGWLLKHAIERGWQAQGVELSEAAVAHARSLGLDVFHGELSEAALPGAGFDLVYMGDVLEHVPDCRAVLMEVSRVLAPGGVLYLRGPITTNSLAREFGLALYGALGRTIVLREPPYHLWEFTPGPLEYLFAQAGLDVVEMRQSKIAPGRAHGAKSPVQRLVMGAIDVVNLPITALFNARGDRVVMVGRKTG
jgi:SAM-dependent methyltransferase